VGAGLLGSAGVLAFYGGAALVTAPILGLATQIVARLAVLIVGAVVLAMANVLALIGKQREDPADQSIALAFPGSRLDGQVVGT
jgi:hypothetical protein